MAVETELKFALQDNNKSRFLKHPLLPAETNTKFLTSVYFDTPRMDLKTMGIGLRIRKKGGQILQTIKADSALEGGLSTREEHEVPVPQAAPDASRLGPFQERLEALMGDLQPQFTTSFSRTEWLLTRSGNQLEIVLDEGHVQSDQGTSWPILEVEIEKKQGTLEFLLETGCRLAGSVPLIPEILSKAARGYWVAQGKVFGSGDFPIALQAQLNPEDIAGVWQNFLVGLAYIRYGREESGWSAMENALGQIMRNPVPAVHPFLPELTTLSAMVRQHNQEALLDSTLPGWITLQIISGGQC